MAYKRADQLLLDVQNDIGLVSGTGVQVYSEPQIYRAIQLMFNLMFRKRFWDHLTDWYELILDGTTGRFTTDINTFCDGAEDVETVWTADFGYQIPRPDGIQYKQVTGGSALYYTPVRYSVADAAGVNIFGKKVLQFWPASATGSVAVRIRTRPRDFLPQDTVPFPSDIISMGAAWRALAMDGINPTAAQAAEKLYEALYSDYISTLGSDEIGYGSGRRHVPLSIRTI